jgi:hypothetical protein
MTMSAQLLYGMAVGLTFADEEEKEFFGLKWGMTIYLGPIVLVFGIPEEE